LDRVLCRVAASLGTAIAIGEAASGWSLSLTPSPVSVPLLVRILVPVLGPESVPVPVPVPVSGSVRATAAAFP